MTIPINQISGERLCTEAAQDMRPSNARVVVRHHTSASAEEMSPA